MSGEEHEGESGPRRGRRFGTTGPPVSRRALLASAAGVGAGGVAGCAGFLGPDEGDSGEANLLEGFEAGNLSNYGGATGQPTVSDERTSQGSRSLRWISGTIDDGTIDTQELAVERPATMTYDIYHDGGGDAAFLFAVQETPSGYKSGSKYVVAARERTGNVFRITRYRNGNRENLARTSYDPPIGEWIEVEVDWREDGTIEASATSADGETLSWIAVPDDTYASGGIGWRSDDIHHVKYYDNLQVE